MSRTVEVLGYAVRLPDPDAVEEVADHCRQIRDRIADSSARLRAAQRGDWSLWRGGAADAFRSAQDGLPADLDRAWASYRTVAETLRTYAGGLREWVAHALRIDAAAQDLTEQLARTGAGRQAAAAAGQDTSALDARIQAMSSELGGLRNALEDLVETDLRDLAAACVRGVHAAQDAGIKNDFWSFVQRYVVDDVVEKIVVKPLTSLPRDVADFAAHPSLARLGHLLGDISGCLLPLMLVPGLGELLIPLTLALDVGKAAVDLGAVAEGEADASILVGDAVSLGSDGVASVASRAAGAGDDAITSALDHGAWARADALQVWQTKRGLIREAPAFSASSWPEVLHNLNPVHGLPALVSDYRTMGVEEFSSPAAVVLHRIAFAGDQVSLGMGIAGDEQLLPDYRPEPLCQPAP